MNKYPNLLGEEIISLDIETYDPHLDKKTGDMGPGVYRRDGYILGISLATENFAHYYNIGHYNVTEDERKHNIEYLRPLLMSDIPKLFANGMYDCDWIMNWQGSPSVTQVGFRNRWDPIPVNGKWYDVQIAEALIDENKFSYNLDSIAEKYLGIHKIKGELEKYCEEQGLPGDTRRWLYKMPSQLVYDYAVGDVVLPLEIFKDQREIIESEGYWDLFELECDLVKTVLKMRKTGCKIDQDRRDRNALSLQNQIEERMIKLRDMFGDFNPNSTKQLAEIFDERGMPYINTEKGNPSIKNEHLQNFFDKDEPYGDNSEYPWVYDLWRVRKSMKVLDTFLLGSYVDFITEGSLIHPSIYATKIQNIGGSVNGTKSGRFAMAKPNGQQIPAKGVDTELGTLARQPFVAFEDCWWGKIDYSQIEYRFTAHFARGPGSVEVRKAYNDDPNTDYHQFIMDLTKLKRRFAKNLNFGVAYGMGARSMARFFGWELDYCYDVLKIYHTKAPYVKSTSNSVERVALRRGYIKTFLGRRARLINKDKAYTMFCRLISGSAADLMKKAMYDIDKAGLFDVLYPHLTVHDEIDVSIPKTKIGVEAFIEMDHIMNSCIDLKVPIKTEAEIGPNWADIEEFDKTEVLKSL